MRIGLVGTFKSEDTTWFMVHVCIFKYIETKYSDRRTATRKKRHNCFITALV